MSSRGETSDKEGGEESSLIGAYLKSPNARRQGRRVRVDDSDDYHEDEFEDEEDQASLNHESKFAPREKSVVEVSKRAPRWD
ncbi:hypothetical protein CK203_100606 [Vitis vinifera]|uniref:Uncharacterized protein n=1 Tax=Vitis vinifera TaxID=29760 RepID=A0A438FIK1_VITVI|nr:hypothetical protein CK203_100606 [Vitis vinifera]